MLEKLVDAVHDLARTLVNELEVQYVNEDMYLAGYHLPTLVRANSILQMGHFRPLDASIYRAMNNISASIKTNIPNCWTCDKCGTSFLDPPSPGNKCACTLDR